MNIKERLSQRIGKRDIHEINHFLQGNILKKQEIFSLLFDSNSKIAYQAAWVMSHFSKEDNQWLSDKQDVLIDEVMNCKHAGKRRLLLNVLYNQPSINLRTDFLDFCLERAITEKEPLAIQSLCMKIAYRLCQSVPELMQEFRAVLEMMEDDLSPAIRAAKNNILKAIKNGKNLQIKSYNSDFIRYRLADDL